MNDQRLCVICVSIEQDGISEPTSSPTLSSESLNVFFEKQFLLCIRAREDNRVDRHNFRLLLWKTMATFPQIVEARSRQVVPLFVEFIRYDFET